MEIEELTLVIRDDDLNVLLARHLFDREGLRDLKAAVLPEGVVLTGRYPTRLFSVPFSAYWEPRIEGRALHIQLKRIKIVGVPVGPFQGMFMSVIRKSTARSAGARVDQDRIILDPDLLSEEKGFPLRTNLRAVECALGKLILRASASG